MRGQFIPGEGLGHLLDRALIVGEREIHARFAFTSARVCPCPFIEVDDLPPAAHPVNDREQAEGRP
jgi:hypothetical protein